MAKKTAKKTQAKKEPKKAPKKETKKVAKKASKKPTKKSTPKRTTKPRGKKVAEAPVIPKVIEVQKVEEKPEGTTNKPSYQKFLKQIKHLVAP